MIEKERKIVLSQKEYSRLDEAFQWHECKKQTNYYYMDSEHILEEKKITVRVREKDNKNLLQFKIPMGEENSLHIHKEYEEEINAIPGVILGTKLREVIHLDIPDAVQIGNLVTLRKKYIWADGTEICLDQNEYLNSVDYEIEIEYINSIDEEIFGVLRKNQIDYSKNVRGKFSRFLNRYKLYKSRDISV